MYDMSSYISKFVCKYSGDVNDILLNRSCLTFPSNNSQAKLYASIVQLAKIPSSGLKASSN